MGLRNGYMGYELTRVPSDNEMIWCTIGDPTFWSYRLRTPLWFWEVY